MTSALRQLAVVVPARNEERLLPRCLDALDEAHRVLRRTRPGLEVSVTVVLDRTNDASAAIVERNTLATALCYGAGNVGRARNFGIRSALRACGLPPAAVWIANTDADSFVPGNWLLAQAEAAEEGWDVMVGTVEPETSDLTEAQLDRWFAAHSLRDGHNHIHGANLGFRADAYERLGGFQGLALHEDRGFVLAAAAAGLRMRATDACRVQTSGRTTSFVRGGFADYLASEIKV
ncbi:MAG: glycosyltransferase [Actinomycetota bacterium]|nr:glycosyltransferase [Actinomycetota bacterium]